MQNNTVFGMSRSSGAHGREGQARAQSRDGIIFRPRGLLPSTNSPETIGVRDKRPKARIIPYF